MRKREKMRIRAEFTASEMRFAHTWCRGAHEVGCVGFSYTPSRVARTSARGIARPASNVGDIQVVPRPANTLGRLRIMIPYCIQIRIPTVRCMGIDTKIALSLGNAPPALRKLQLSVFFGFLFYSRADQETRRIRWKDWTLKSFSLVGKKVKKQKAHLLIYLWLENG